MRRATQYLFVGAMIAAVQAMVACGSGLSGSGGSQINPSVEDYARHPVAHPTLLWFYSRHPLTFTVRERGYFGRFTMSDSACKYIATVSPKSAKGPSARFNVTPLKSASGGVCVVRVADTQGHAAKVTVSNPGY